MFKRKTTTTLVSYVVAALLCYLTVCMLFIFFSAYTTYTCPGKNNTPTSWDLPKYLQPNPSQPFGRYALLDAKDWQLPNYQAVTFASRMKNTNIVGWYTEIDKNAPVIIVVHGIRPNCKSAYLNLLASGLLAHGGLNVLNIDLQNYGDSSKNAHLITFGQKEYLDILGAFDWLQTQGYASNQIGVMGLSLGAVTSAIALSQEPQLKAVWLDSPFSDFDRMFCYELATMRLPCFFRYGVNYLAWVLTGTTPSAIPVSAAIAPQNDHRIFLTHGMKDQRIPFEHAQHFLSLAAQQDVTVENWLVQESAHIEAIQKYPRVYQKKMLAFFNSHLHNTSARPE